MWEFNVPCIQNFCVHTLTLGHKLLMTPPLYRQPRCETLCGEGWFKLKRFNYYITVILGHIIYPSTH